MPLWAIGENNGASLSAYNQTVRSIVHLSLGREKIRVRISNAFGDKPLTISTASVGVRETDSTIVTGTIKTLTFGGESSITIPMGTDIFTDPVGLTVTNDSDLAINLFVTDGPVLPTIDDGFGSDLDAANNYPSNLARRMLETPEFKKSSVVNAAISGNRLLAGASFFGPIMTAKMEKDILAQSGVTHIILSNGNNDIGLPEIGDRLPDNDTFEHVTAAQLVAGLKQMIVKAHSRNIKIICGTFLPYRGSSLYSELGDEKRQLVNQWIRTSGAFNGYVDFAAVIGEINSSGFSGLAGR
jgi:lysophospholipase L1-like esterase